MPPVGFEPTYREANTEFVKADRFYGPILLRRQLICGRRGTRTPSPFKERIYSPRGFQLPVTLPNMSLYKCRPLYSCLILCSSIFTPFSIRVTYCSRAHYVTHLYQSHIFCVSSEIRTQTLTA